MVLISMETDLIRYSTSQGDFWNQQAKGFHSRHILNSFKHSRGFKNAPYGTADLIRVFDTRNLENLQEAITFDPDFRFHHSGKSWSCTEDRGLVALHACIRSNGPHWPARKIAVVRLHLWYTPLKKCIQAVKLGRLDKPCLTCRSISHYNLLHPFWTSRQNITTATQ